MSVRVQLFLCESWEKENKKSELEKVILFWILKIDLFHKTNLWIQDDWKSFVYVDQHYIF